MPTFNALFTLITIFNLGNAQVPIEPIESFDVTTHETEKTTTITLPTTTRIETAADIDAITSNPDKATRTDEKISITPPPNSTSVTPRPAPEPGILTRVYRIIKDQIRIFIHTPKVSSVMKNIATCVVNGAMELITYYFPTPLIPIIASAAGMLIPFEPVLMLRDRVPVTSYRRAFLTAMNSFLGTFDKYKLEDNNEYDPYMTQRFNRRMMNFGSAEKKKSKGFQ